MFAGGGERPRLCEINASIAVAALDGRVQEKDLIAGTCAHLTATGDLIYAQNGTLMAVPFNSKRLELAGSPRPCWKACANRRSERRSIASRPAGRWCTLREDCRVPRPAWCGWIGQGKEQSLAAPAHGYNCPRLSPDGRRIAITISETDTHVWLIRHGARCECLAQRLAGRKHQSDLVARRQEACVSVPTGRGLPNLFCQPADGSGAAERLTTSPFINVASSWSPDGQTIAFIEVNPRPGYDIWTVGLGDRKARPFLKTQYNETRLDSPPTGTGWRTRRMNRGGGRCMCSRIRGRAESGRSRPKEGRSRCGIRPAASCSTVRGTA